jgi:hypothetical protein
MWDEIIEAVREHPKLQGKELPDALLVVSGDAWERDAKQVKALGEFLSANGMELPANLVPFSERGKVAEWLRRSAGQTSRRAKESAKE